MKMAEGRGAERHRKRISRRESTLPPRDSFREIWIASVAVWESLTRPSNVITRFSQVTRTSRKRLEESWWKRHRMFRAISWSMLARSDTDFDEQPRIPARTRRSTPAPSPFLATIGLLQRSFPTRRSSDLEDISGLDGTVGVGHAGRGAVPLVKDDRNPELLLQGGYRPDGEAVDAQVRQMDRLPVHLEVLVNAPARHGGDERRGGDLGGGNHGHLELRRDLRRQGVVEEPENHLDVGPEVPRGERGVEIRQVVVGREDDGPRLLDIRQQQVLLEPRFADQHRDPPVLHLLHEHAVAILLDGNHRLLGRQEFLDDAIPHAAEPAEDDVVAVGRGFHDPPLLKLPLAGEDEVAEADDAVRHGAEADDRDEKEQRLVVPGVREIQARLDEDEREHAEAGLAVRQGHRAGEQSPAENHEEPEDDERPPEFTDDVPHPAQEFAERAHRHVRRIIVDVRRGLSHHFHWWAVVFLVA